MDWAKQRVANEKKKQNEKKRKAEKPLPRNPHSPIPKMKARAVQNDGTTELKSRGNVLGLSQKKFKIHKEQAFFAGKDWRGYPMFFDDNAGFV